MDVDWRKAHWSYHLYFVLMLIGPLWIFRLSGGLVMKTISLAWFAGAALGAIEFYTGKKWNLGEVVDTLLMRRLERRARKHFVKK